MAWTIQSFSVYHRGLGVARGTQLELGRPLRASLLLHHDGDPEEEPGEGGGSDPDDDALPEQDDGAPPQPEARAAIVSVEATDKDDETNTQTVELLVTVPPSRRVVVAAAAPPGARQVYFVARVRDDAEDPEDVPVAERRHPSGQGSVELTERSPASPVGLAVPAPNIYEVLQQRPKSAARGSGALKIFSHVVQQLRDLPGFFADVFDRPPYTPLPGEVGEDGGPATALASWQREVIEKMSGAYYAYCGRRNIQDLHYGVGYPLTAVCNNNVDIVSWLRGADPINWDGLRNPSQPSTSGVGFNCCTDSLRLFAEVLGVQPLVVPQGEAAGPWTDPEPPGEGPFLHDFTAVHARKVDAYREWSFRQARPGSVFVYGRSSDRSRKAHINLALRVRRVDGVTQVQLFDTGAVSADVEPNTLSRTLGLKGKALSEEVWRTHPGEWGSTKCVGHVFWPVRGRRALPDTPIQAGNGPGGPGSGWGGIVVQDGAADPIPARVRAGLVRAGDVEGTLRAQATRALAHLAIFRRAGAPADPGDPAGVEVDGQTLLYLSRPLRLARPLSHLVGSVSLHGDGGDPDLAQRYEARWLVKLRGDFLDFARCNGSHPRGSSPKHCQHPVVELYNDAAGLTRHWRGERSFTDPAFTARFAALWDLMNARRPAGAAFYHQRALRPSDEWPADAETPWRSSEWDALLADVAEGPAPHGFRDGIATAS